jgi:hypothetical protein
MSARVGSQKREADLTGQEQLGGVTKISQQPQLQQSHPGRWYMQLIRLLIQNSPPPQASITISVVTLSNGIEAQPRMSAGFAMPIPGELNLRLINHQSLYPIYSGLFN